MLSPPAPGNCHHSIYCMETLSGVLQGIGTVPSGTDLRHGFAAKMILALQVGDDHPGDGMRAFCKWRGRTDQGWILTPRRTPLLPER